ncbi:hypothetical protein [Desulfobacter postgatei]|uniref:hypothetical protein n=1 Tax=Desulfobacter postgatei TaxID=2293 RepID=UPI000232B644|nr:hypothetical protein [Desulfobacter postgatei]
MSIKSFIQEEILMPRLQKAQVLAVYDPDCRYGELCLGMADDKRRVVDAGPSSITSRAAAIEGLSALGRHEIDQLLIYVPAAKPVEEEEKQRDPFALYLACGAVFPDGDGDTYLSICLKAKPDHATQVRDVFAKDENPGFAVIDAIGGGFNWPNLRALLSVESTRDILFALLSPSDRQQDALKGNDAWVGEVKDLLKGSIGLSLKTKGKTWSTIADELWRYLLFSEFMFDLPESLPESLSNVPHAPGAAKPLIEDICERLRNDRRTQNVYVLRAESIESKSEGLNLVEACSHIKDLGIKDTFPFEERTFLRNAITSLLDDDIDQAREIISGHAASVWNGKGESQAQWYFLRSAVSLIECCQDNDRALQDHGKSMDALIDFYKYMDKYKSRLRKRNCKFLTDACQYIIQLSFQKFKSFISRC